MTKRELAARAALFREGTRRIYEGDRKLVEGDMWLFEMFHFLGDVEEKLSGEQRQERVLSKLPVIA